VPAYPFGGHPTFGHYIHWALSAGCQVQSGYTADDAGRPHAITKITSPDGSRWVIEAADQREHLPPTTIARLDRRLGLKSPFETLENPANPAVKDAK
jgi:hypothetical protein